MTTTRPDAEPVGTVAEEAARLVEMLASGAGPWPGAGRPGASGAGEDEHECTCGGRTPQACRLCPVCQLVSFVGAISPETIDRAADLVGFAATALRDLATYQRSRQADAGPAPGGAAPDDGPGPG